MIESHSDTRNHTANLTQSDANNNQNDECKPLTILSSKSAVEKDNICDSKCLESLNSVLHTGLATAAVSGIQSSANSNVQQQPTTASVSSYAGFNVTSSSNVPARSNVSSSRHNTGRSTNIGGNSATPTAGHYVPQQPKSERKAAKTLSAILFAFIITWTPYNIVALLRSVLPEGKQDYIPKQVSLFFYI